MNEKLQRLAPTPVLLNWLSEHLHIESADQINPDFSAMLDTLPSGIYRVDKGVEIVSEGDKDQDFYVLYAGKAGVWVRKNQAVPTQIAELQAGDFFGEIGFIMGTRRTASIKTITEATVFRFDVESFKSLLEKHKQLAAFIRSTAAERLRSIYLGSL
ncbi:MAG TPA: cyclic nucleotide-binding domain-containing protein [Elusimicrobiales bacterium]|nr:cyclic nucleotide-binding domain-containing protein [Elusimicrobiales bacterium]